QRELVVAPLRLAANDRARRDHDAAATRRDPATIAVVATGFADRLVGDPALDLECADIADLRALVVTREAFDARAGLERHRHLVEGGGADEGLDAGIAGEHAEQSRAIAPQREPRVLEANGGTHEVALVVDHDDLDRAVAAGRLDRAAPELELHRAGRQPRQRLIVDGREHRD